MCKCSSGRASRLVESFENLCAAISKLYYDLEKKQVSEGRVSWVLRHVL